MLDSLCVTTSTEIAPTKSRKELAARIGWLALICATLYVCYFSHLGAIGFVGPDEPRYAWIARDMAETGDWVTPRLYGKPWFEKPPLYYWGAAISFKLFGVSEAAARLPSAISALLATLAMAWLAWRIYDAETARWLLLLLPTTVGMIGFSHAAATDMPFSAMLTIAMVCAAVIVGLVPERSGQDTEQPAEPLRDERVVPLRPWLALILFGFFLGLAVLAKGPAGIILCGGAVFFWALLTKRWRDVLRLLHPAAIAAFCVTALPWYILVARRNPDFFRIFIIEHNFKRFLTPEFQHIQPFWFYGPILLFALFPWTGIAISAVTYVFRRKLGMAPGAPSIYVLCWAFFPIIFFTVSKSKLPGYILPAIPAFTLLTALAVTKALRMERVPVPTGFAVIALTPVAAIAAVGLSAYFQPRPQETWFRPYAVECLLLSCVAVFVVSVLSISRKYASAILAGCIAWVCFLFLTYLRPLPLMDPWFSPRAVASTVLHIPRLTADVRSLDLQRAWQFGFNFYLQRELREWDPSRPEGYVLASISGMQKLNKSRIPFQVLDDRSFQATLILISSPQPGSKPATKNGIT
jgi:4-amino-4-deoxy-L-arabinose transferase-like glycosyltransferase